MEPAGLTLLFWHNNNRNSYSRLLMVWNGFFLIRRAFMYCLTSYASPIGLLTLGSDGKHLTGLWI